MTGRAVRVAAARQGIRRLACLAGPAAVALLVAGVLGAGAVSSTSVAAAASGAPSAHEAGTGPGSTPGTPGTAPPPKAPSLLGLSYTLATGNGGLVGFGGALRAADGTVTSPVVGVAGTADGKGAWSVEADGAVIPFGDAKTYGSMAGHALRAPIVGIAGTPTGGGYWLVAADGGVFSFGDAQFYGSTGDERLNQPVVGMAATPTGGGYWLVAADGGIFTFGDAQFYGSTGDERLNQPVVGMAPSSTGHGYWLVAADGGIFTFGDAQFYGSTGAEHLVKPVVGMAATPTGGGYWLVASDGGIFTFGDAPFYGSAATFGRTMVGMAIEVGGYQNPLRQVASLVPERVDQGVDYAGSGPIYALGDGVVLNTTNSGWPGGAFITYQLTDGPAEGAIVYVAENVVPRVTIGEQVTSSTVVGTLVDAYPNLEIGWAMPPGNGESLARGSGQWNTALQEPTGYGANFSALLTVLGAPAGLLNGPVHGTLPATWPAW